MEENERTVLAKNAFVPTREHYAQAYSDMTKFSDLLLFGFVVLMALVLLLSSLLSEQPFFSKDNLVPLIALGIAVVAVIAQHFLLPRLYGSRTMKRIEEAYGKNGELTVTVEPEGVRMHNAANDSEVGFRFESFARFSETRDLLLMRTAARQMLMVSKTGFADGMTESSFKALMCEKCPQAKARWK